jgi:hypothetical protein
MWERIVMEEAAQRTNSAQGSARMFARLSDVLGSPDACDMVSPFVERTLLFFDF